MGYSTYCSLHCVREAGHSGEHNFRPNQIAESVERVRSHHDRTLGHRPTNVVGYCATPDDVSAVHLAEYCEIGILLAAIP